MIAATIDTEDGILGRVDIDEALTHLEPCDRDMMILIFRYEWPADWTGSHAPTYDEIGEYIGNKYEGRALSEATIRYRRDGVLAEWRRQQALRPAL